MSRAVFHSLRAARLTAVGLSLVALSACTAGSMGGSGSGAVGPSGTAAQGRTSLETQQACRQRANEMYDQRNRGDTYAANPSVNTPYSANYLPGITSRGLSGQFAYEQTVADCERNGTPDRVDTPAPAPAPVPAPPPGRGR